MTISQETIEKRRATRKANQEMAYKMAYDSCADKAYQSLGLEPRWEIIKKVAAARVKLGLPITVCPCDPKDKDRGCIGPKCYKDLLEKGKCLCGCYRRIYLTLEEVKALLKMSNVPFETFEEYMQDHYKVVYEGNIYYTPWSIWPLISKYMKRDYNKTLTESAIEYLKENGTLSV